MANIIEEVRINQDELKSDCYKIKFNENHFNISFGTLDREKKRVLVNAEINFSPEGFSEFFNKIMICISDYEAKTGNNFFNVKGEVEYYE